MTDRLPRLIVFAVLLVAITATTRAATAQDSTAFRGGDLSGLSKATNVPGALNDESKVTVGWQAALPGRGPASPIVVGNRVFIAASSGAAGDMLHMLCFDLESGKQLWARRVRATGSTTVHPFGANAAPTPCSDGQRVFALYSCCDLTCFDLDGNLLWYRALGIEHPTTRNDVGMSSSPVVVGDAVVVQLENQGESFLTAIETTTGETRWRRPRDRAALWATPIPLPGRDGTPDQVLAQGRDRLTAYDMKTGETAWEFEAPCHTITTGTVGPDGDVYLPARGLHRLRPAADRASAKLLWVEERLASGNASPTAVGDKAYIIKSSGVLVCASAEDGRMLWQLRLSGPFWASPVIADGKLYAISHKGLLQVVDLTGEKGEIIAKKEIEGAPLASPVAVDGGLLIRTDGKLVMFVTK